VAGLGQDYLTGLVRLESELLILLDIERVLHDGRAELADMPSCNA
jgi:chemotaxis signal transduction protein